MKKILLSQGRYALVDDEDFEELSRYNWSYYKNHNVSYAIRRALRTENMTPTRKTIHMHRVVLGAKEGQQVDHINGNGLDNRRSNLRICTHAENMRNRGKQVNNTSGFKGVVFHNQRNKWQARMRLNGKIHSFGLFTRPEDAHAAYVEASKKLHGDFSVFTRAASG